MINEQYDNLYLNEKKYWWSIGRRNLVIDFWKRFGPNSQDSKALELGCGTGAMLSFLSESSGIEHVFGIDNSQRAISYSLKSGLNGKLLLADSLYLPVKELSFDLVISVDMLEHCSDDVGIIGEMHRALKPQGLLLVTVPANQFLWSDHDVRLGHKRRYSAKELREKVAKAGFTVKNAVILTHSIFLFYLRSLF